jgi:SAM-dependent methyltransferase
MKVTDITGGIREENIREQDLIIDPAKRTGPKPGFHSKAMVDHEVGMARSDCYNAAKHAAEIFDQLRHVSEMQGIEGWVASKITLAADYLNTFNDYLQGQQVQRDSGIVDELSTNLLGRYKKAAGADSIAADRRGDYAHSHKRFKGVNTATKKQFANDAKARSVEEDIPPPENAQKTQIAGTLPTYVKGKQHLDTHHPEGKTLDFGAGLGGGAAALGADSYEPFPRANFKPTYTKASDIPDNSYQRVTNFNVLNVVPQEIRNEIVKNIGRVLAPGGIAIITTRGKDVMGAKGSDGPEPMSRITTIGTYQKGFTTKELIGYVQSILGNGFDVKPLKLGPAGVLIRKAKQEVGEDAQGIIRNLKLGRARSQAGKKSPSEVYDKYAADSSTSDQARQRFDRVSKVTGPRMFEEQDLTEDLNTQFDLIEEWVESIAQQHGVDAEQIWEDFEAVDDATLLETAAWQKKSGKSKSGGLNKRGVASYRREHPGSKLQTAVTTKPSKLKPGSKAAKRRKSFCARMGGMKGPMKDEHGKPTRKALALRKWNC